MAVFSKVNGHRETHIAEPDEANFREGEECPVNNELHI